MAAWIDAGALHPAAVTPPVSKSDAQRAAVLEAIAGRLPAPPDADEPADVAVLKRGLRALAAHGDARIDCGDGGTPLRLLLGQAALRENTTLFHGSLRLAERGHDPLLQALEAGLGIAIGRGAPWPLTVRGTRARRATPRLAVDARASSQFASSLLLTAAALARREGRPWRLAITGEAASQGYLALTLHWLALAGYRLAAADGAIEVAAGDDRPLPAPPADWSGAAYLLILAWKAGGVVRVDPAHAHPDRAILDVLEQTGLAIRRDGDGVRVDGEAVRGVDASGLDSPDLLPTLAALAVALPGRSVLRDTAILRRKESDRLAALIRMVESAGATVHGDDRRLEIRPGRAPARLAVAVAGDHRMAMSAAVLAAVTGARVRIDHPAAVAKSFPGFWNESRRLGLSLTPLRPSGHPDDRDG